MVEELFYLFIAHVVVVVITREVADLSISSAMAMTLASTVSLETEGGWAGILTGPSLKRLPTKTQKKKKEVRSEKKKSDRRS
jgi:hypothetical protein